MYVKSRMFVVDAPSIDGPRHRTYIPEHLQASGILYHIIRPSLHRASASGPRASRRAFDSVEGGGIGGGCLDLSRRNRHFSRAQTTSLTSQPPPTRRGRRRAAAAHNLLQYYSIDPPKIGREIALTLAGVSFLAAAATAVAFQP